MTPEQREAIRVELDAMRVELLDSLVAHVRAYVMPVWIDDPIAKAIQTGAHQMRDRIVADLEALKATIGRPSPITTPSSLKHAYKAHPRYPWFCKACGYPEHETVMHEARP